MDTSDVANLGRNNRMANKQPKSLTNPAKTTKISTLEGHMVGCKSFLNLKLLEYGFDRLHEIISAST